MIAGDRRPSKKINIDIPLYASFDPLTAAATFGSTGSYIIANSGEVASYQNGHLIIDYARGGEIKNIASDTVLFQDGYTNVALTGGWDYTNYTYQDFPNNGRAYWNKEMVVQVDEEKTCCICGTERKLDLTNVNSVNLVWSSKTDLQVEGNPSLRICSTKETADAVIISGPEEGNFSADVSGLSGEYYIAVVVYAPAGVSYARLCLTDLSLVLADSESSGSVSGDSSGGSSGDSSGDTSGGEDSDSGDSGDTGNGSTDTGGREDEFPIVPIG